MTVSSVVHDKNMEHFTIGLEFRMSLQTKKIRCCGK